MSQEWNRSLIAVTATVVLIHGLKTTVTPKESWNCVTNRESAEKHVAHDREEESQERRL